MGGKSTKASNVESLANASFFGSRLTSTISTSPRRARFPEQIKRDKELKF
jgi:hypothetical protein